MALKKPTPSFEDTAVADTAVAEAPKAEAAPAAAKVEATTAIAKAATTSVAVNSSSEEAKRFQAEFDAMQGAADFAYGNYRIFKGIDGEIRCTEQGSTLSLGRNVTVRLLAWAFHWQIAPGSDATKAKEFVAFSDDGETVSSVIGEDLRHFVGKPVNTYLDYLRSEGYDKAESKRYLDTAVAVLGSESGKHEPGDVVQITFSPSSISSFSQYQEKLKTRARGVQLGLPGFTMPADPFTFKVAAESASKGSNRWTKLAIQAV